MNTDKLAVSWQNFT